MVGTRTYRTLANLAIDNVYNNSNNNNNRRVVVVMSSSDSAEERLAKFRERFPANEDYDLNEDDLKGVNWFGGTWWQRKADEEGYKKATRAYKDAIRDKEIETGRTYDPDANKYKPVYDDFVEGE